MIGPKIGLYRNISITFIIFTIMMACFLFLFFYSKATIIMVPNSQKMNLSFNVEVKKNPSAEELSTKDVVQGVISISQIKESGKFDVLSTKTVSSSSLGKIKIVNKYSKNQALVKTTQLQATNGVIVRTTDSVVVPAGGSVEVGVIPKDPAQFSDIEAGQLKIIKLSPDLQNKIYGINSDVLTNKPHEIKLLAASDINRAKEDLTKKAIEEAKKQLGLKEGDPVSLKLASFKTDKKVGDSASVFNLEAVFKVNDLQLDQAQLLDLMNRKVESLNLKGLAIGDINAKDIKYSITDTDVDGSILIKIDYTLNTALTGDNEALKTENFIGKTAEEVQNYLNQTGLVKSAEVHISPYWAKTLPKQKDKIKIIIQPQ
ncbi:MAG: hypothetical protein WC516_07585 [Patescibacteria group bacterium]